MLGEFSNVADLLYMKFLEAGLGEFSNVADHLYMYDRDLLYMYDRATKAWLDPNYGWMVLQTRPRLEVHSDIWHIVAYFQLKCTPYRQTNYFIYFLLLLYWATSLI